MRLQLSDEIRCTFEGYSRLARLWRVLSQIESTAIEIDCQSLRGFDAHMVAPLSVIRDLAVARRNIIHFRNLSSRVNGIFHRNGFLSRTSPDTMGSTIQFRRFEITHHREFNDYLDSDLRNQSLPIMSEALEYLFFLGINELFSNAAIHSETEHGVVCCGQYYPRKHRLDFTLSDAGIGIRENLRRRMNINISSADAIQWAMKRGHTTRQLDVPGGLGLKIVQNFIRLNKGRLIVVSDEGYWCLNGKAVESRALPAHFPGTSVTLEVRTDDMTRYFLAGESLEDLLA
jgi:hypothetical protein